LAGCIDSSSPGSACAGLNRASPSWAGLLCEPLGAVALLERSLGTANGVVEPNLCEPELEMQYLPELVPGPQRTRQQPCRWRSDGLIRCSRPEAREDRRRPLRSKQSKLLAHHDRLPRRTRKPTSGWRSRRMPSSAAFTAYRAAVRCVHASPIVHTVLMEAPDRGDRGTSAATAGQAAVPCRTPRLVEGFEHRKNAARNRRAA
jgi:hypothetical protein